MTHPFERILTTPAEPTDAAGGRSSRRSFFNRLFAAATGVGAALLGRDASAQFYHPPRFYRRSWRSRATTLAYGEEGGVIIRRPPSQVTTFAVGEEGGRPPVVSTRALGEEGGGTVTTYALGEEGGGPRTRPRRGGWGQPPRPWR